MTAKNLQSTLQLTKVNAFIMAQQTWRLENSHRPHRQVIEIALCFSCPQLVHQREFAIIMEKKDAIFALGNSWINSPSGAVDRFDLQIVLRKMVNNHYELTHFVDFLTTFGYWLNSKKLLPEFEKNRRKNMAIRHPIRACRHQYANTEFLVRCTHCGWTRRKGTVVFERGWKNRANG
jgi:hypothetical protein